MILVVNVAFPDAKQQAKLCRRKFGIPDKRDIPVIIPFSLVNMKINCYFTFPRFIYRIFN